ncbi:MAG: DUF4350 domain-containing protein [Rhodocyclales bacterium]|nr:DUF4350 domain-containing protein [Rhodocyclales bacterium]
MRHKAILIILLVLLALSGWVFHLRYEFVTAWVDEGPGPLALRDPLLAARRYLESAGTPVSVADRLLRDEALEQSGTLIIAAETEVVSSRQAGQVLDWVARGGHMIVTASAHEDDPLLARFGVSRARIADTDDCDCEASRAGAEQAEEDPPSDPSLGGAGDPPVEAPPAMPAESASGDERGLIEFAFEDFPERPKVRFDPRYVLNEIEIDEDEHDEWFERVHASGGPEGIHLVQYEWGEGLVTVMSDQDPWHNDNIGRHDHALFLEALIDLERPVLVLHGSPMPSLLALVAAHGREALLAATLFLAAWLVRRARRFGPLRTVETLHRRALGEHILAASRYRWRRGGAASLLDGARLAVLDRARRRLPDQMQADPAQQCHTLAQHTGLPVEVVRNALQTDPGMRAPTLQATAKGLQSLWKRL